jgi:proline iminopeptidase
MNTTQSHSVQPRTSIPEQIKDNRMGIILAVGIVVLAAWLVNFWLPRGATTQIQALLLLGGSVGLGVLGGYLMQSRWAMLLLPVVHILVLEFSRPELLGATTGAIRFDEIWGILAFVLGRGLYGLLAIIPMILGAYLGTTFAISSSSGGLMRWTAPGLVTIALAGFAAWIALPASTPPILGADGKPVPTSIAELITVRLGGHDQSIMIRAYSPDKPVLLYLNGGPGQSGLAYTRVMLEDFTRDFVVVDWDQRGTGKSYAALEPTATLTLERAILDTIELTRYLQKRFAEQKIYLLGESWGSTLGALVVQRQPDLFHAFIGSGQMVSQRETDRRLFQEVIDYANRNNNQALVNKMQRYGQPPYKDIPFAYGFVMNYYNALYKPYTPSSAYLARGNAAGIEPFGIMGSEYNLIEKFNVLRGLMDMFTVMYPQLQNIDFRRDITRLEIPVYILDGQAELSARRDLALEWFELLQAPKKQLFSFENTAHAVAFEGFLQFHKVMLETILPETYQTYSR